MINVIVLLLFFIFLVILWAFFIVNVQRTAIEINPCEYQLDAQNISLATEDNILLKGWLIRNSKTNKTIILVHGFSMNKGEMLKRTYFLAKNYNLLYLDCRGAGESEGKSQVGLKENKDIKAAVSYLKNNCPEISKEIALYGISMGSAAAAYYTAVYGGIKCLVLESSYYSFKQVAKQWMWEHSKIPYFPFVALLILWQEHKLGQKVESFALNQTAPKITCPVLMIQGEEDALTPIEEAQKTYKLLAGPKEFWAVPQARHLSCYKVAEQQYIEKITAFFDKNL